MPGETLNAARDIADLFLKLEGFRGNPPKHDRRFAASDDYFLWYYWWGKAKTGWDGSEGICLPYADVAGRRKQCGPAPVPDL